MPPRMPQVSGEDIVKALQRLGFEPVRQRGSHVVLKKQLHDREVGCVVPLHHGHNIAPGTLRSILRQAEITLEELLEAL
jgi:predicted RNA binding protein YcfA (HicA-like mRNA interferase family)